MCLARALVSLVALVALGAPAQAAEPLRAQCPSPAVATCRLKARDPDGPPFLDYFIVDGHQMSVRYEEGASLVEACESWPLSAARPSFPRRALFRELELYGCAPPAPLSYAAALRARNILLGETLLIYDLQADACLTASSFLELPPSLRKLVIRGSGSSAIPARAALGALEQVRELRLRLVTPASLPPRLDVLELEETGIRDLPPEALNVLSLKLTEYNLTSIAGPAPRLVSLRLTAPALESLALEAAPLETLEGDLLAAGVALRRLRLRRLRVRTLARTALRGADHLQDLELTGGNFSCIPAGFFDYSPELRYVDLSDNALETLPGGLFFRLTMLEELRLSNNRLGADSLRAAALPASLVALRLSGNPLGDLCSTPAASSFTTGSSSVLAPLQRLQQLELAGTRAGRVCSEWARSLLALRSLDLRDNSVRDVTCALLRASTSRLVLELAGNPVERVVCDETS